MARLSKFKADVNELKRIGAPISMARASGIVATEDGIGSRLDDDCNKQVVGKNLLAGIITDAITRTNADVETAREAAIMVIRDLPNHLEHNPTSAEALSNIISEMIKNPGDEGYKMVTIAITAERADCEVIDKAFIASSDNILRSVTVSGTADTEKHRDILVDNFNRECDSLENQSQCFANSISRIDGAFKRMRIERESMMGGSKSNDK